MTKGPRRDQPERVWLDKLSALRETSRKEVGEGLRAHRDRMRRESAQQLEQALRAAYGLEQEQARAIAQFRFDHSEAIVELESRDPSSVARIAGRHGDVPFDDRGLHEFVQTLRTLQELGIALPDREEAPPPNSPVITSCPESLTVGHEYTLLGRLFGETRGILHLDVTGCPDRIQPRILSWSGTAVRFQIADSVGQIPYHANGLLTLRRAQAAGASGSWTDDPDTRIAVTVEPLEDLHSCRAESSDSGTEAPWYVYDTVVELESAPLPQEYRIFESPGLLTSAGLYVQLVNHSSHLLQPSGSEFELVGGPVEVGGALRAWVRVTDAWHWDYTLSVDFYILVPQGYPIATGW